MQRLERLRNLFLAASEGKSPNEVYWQDFEDLKLYDQSLGQRIVWKWKHVFTEIKKLGMPIPRGQVLDFGCGAGAVGQALVESFGKSDDLEMSVWDHSKLAIEYTQKKLSDLKTVAWNPDPLQKWDWVFVSHVLNELTSTQKNALITILKNTRYGIIVEPGTNLDFKNLAGVRQALLKDFEMLAPCTHSKKCPLQESEKDWCHHFAETPAEVFADAKWSQTATELGIDISSLPYSYLVFKNKKESTATSDLKNYERFMGSARIYKGFAKILSCHAEHGVRELEFQKREDGDLFRDIKKGRMPRLAEWEYDAKNPTRLKSMKAKIS